MSEREAKRLEKLASAAKTDYAESRLRMAAREERAKSKKPKKETNFSEYAKKMEKAAKRDPLAKPYDIRYVDIDSTFAHLGRIGFDLAWGARGIGKMVDDAEIVG